MPATPTYPAGATATATIRAALAARDGGMFCRYCECPLAERTTGAGIEVVPWQPCPGGHHGVYPCEEGGHGPSVRLLPGYEWPQIDHDVPRSRGGSDELDNLVLACGPCNGRKGARTAAEFLAAGR